MLLKFDNANGAEVVNSVRFSSREIVGISYSIHVKNGILTSENIMKWSVSVGLFCIHQH